ncbi:uncharacterized protein RSE6_14984 [Rhynchosporium secalis]|uniref:Uncharacterized protein n=1 Tax=Rhynchosporium secalis TaxID=38038 RepID=A0A1E1MWG9_RHYSE|nr:uncharacterized protein RSE6_14984 [Rhynchosporium secalis]
MNVLIPSNSISIVATPKAVYSNGDSRHDSNTGSQIKAQLWVSSGRKLIRVPDTDSRYIQPLSRLFIQSFALSIRGPLIHLRSTGSQQEAQHDHTDGAQRYEPPLALSLSFFAFGGGQRVEEPGGEGG